MRIGALIIFMTCVIAFGVRARTHSGEVSITPSHESPTSATLYARHCSRCHGKDGRAKGIRRSLSGARDLTDPGWQDRVSDERIFNVISNGKAKMPGFAKKISERDIESLVQFVRSLRKG
jgi:Cytochrome C oxidase, cbb3-type, subunit III